MNAQALTASHNPAVVNGPNRRSFLKWSGIAGGAATLVACGSSKEERGSATAGPADGLAEADATIWSACTVNCGSRCPLRLQVKDGVVVRILPDNTGDDSQFQNHTIRACVRGRSIREKIYSPHRIKKPLKRKAGTKRGDGEYEEISWEQAFDEIAQAMRRTIETHGNEALYANNGTGTTGGNMLHRRLLWRFFDAAGGSLQPLRNYSNAAFLIAAKYHYGGAGSSNSTVDGQNSKLQVMFGLNQIETRMSGGGELYNLQHIRKEKGIRTIVIDPRYSETALTIGDQWIAIRPGTDAALVAGLVHVMIAENLHDQDFLDTYCVGFDDAHLPEGAPAGSSYRAYVEGKGPDGIAKTPQWAADITGVPAETIVELAREIASAKPCAITAGWGMQRRANGENQSRAVFTLAAVTGNVGISGGGTGGWTSSYAMPLPTFPELEKPVTVGIPVFKWSDAVDRGPELTALKDGVEGAEKLNVGIKFMISYAANTIMNQHADPARIREILADESKLETLVIIDTLMTASAKMGDYILPDAMSVEQPDLVKNEDSGEMGYAIYAQKAIDPPGDAKPVYEILSEILTRVDEKAVERFTEGRTQAEWVSHMYNEGRAENPEFPSEQEFARRGVIRQKNPAGFTVALKDFREDPEANPLATPSGKIEIFSEALAEMARTWQFDSEVTGDRITAVPEYVESWEGPEEAAHSDEYPLLCINHHTKGRTHSSYWEQPWIMEAHPQHVWINPLDAEDRGIATDDPIRVDGKRGALRSIAFVTERIAPGVISVPQGAWYTPDADGVDDGACASTLASLTSTPIAKGNTQQQIIAQVTKL
ncbi:DMSO/selenate family reductase complex A subunit [Actinomycetaceae bacterium L2_0104]